MKFPMKKKKVKGLTSLTVKLLNAGDVYVLNSQEVHSYEDIGDEIPGCYAPISFQRQLHHGILLPRVSNNPRAKLTFEFIRKTMDTYYMDKKSTRKLISMKVRKQVMYHCVLSHP